jgi:predicted ArsR family transcriptional regulator
MPPGRTRRAIVRLLKQAGALDAAALARRLKVTPMAVRQHLYALEREKLVASEARAVPIGRPRKLWRLTREADRLFPDAYAELTVALIGAMGEAIGPGGVQRVLDARSAAQCAAYRRRIPAALPLGDKLRELARVRTEEGYMAEVRREGGAYLFVENHCPICAAATACQGFCSAEQAVFREVLGPRVSVERSEHIVSGGRRCVYRVAPAAAARAPRAAASGLS